MTTNLVGQRVLIVGRGTRRTYERGIVRAVNFQNGVFALLIEASGEVSDWGTTNGGLVQVTMSDETVEIVVDREAQ